MRKTGRFLAAALLLGLLLLAGGCGKKGEDESILLTGDQEISSESVQSGNPLDATDIDVVIVMDESGSMLSADRQRIAIEAAKMFIDMEKASGVDTAIVEFSNDVTNSGLIHVQDREGKEHLKNILDNIEYVNLAHTDTGAALKEAVATLNGSGTDHKKAIILFTDGRTEITQGERTLEESQADVAAAVQEASAAGYRIYTVGLNNNGNVDEQELNSISLQTNGRTLIANDVNELPAFFNEIFKELGNIDEIPLGELIANGDYQEVIVPIENNNILEANIVMLSNMQIQDVKLYDPTGAEMDLSGSQFVFTTSQKYSVLKLLAPQEGDWKLAVKGIEGDKIKISLLYNYNINMVTSFSANQVKAGDVIVAQAWLTNEGTAIQDNNFYAGMAGTVTVTCDRDGSSREIPLTLADGKMTAEITLDTVGTHQAVVHMEGQGLYRDSEPVVLELVNQVVVQVKNLPTLELDKGDRGSIDLAEYFEDADGDSIAFKAEAEDASLIDTAVNGTMLEYEALERGETAVKVTADDGKVGTAEAVINCDINSFVGRHLPVILGILIALALILLILLIRQASKSALGFMVVSVEGRGVNEYGGIDSNTYSQAQGISVPSIGKKFTMNKLLSRFAGNYNTITFDDVKKQELAALLSKISGPSKSVKFIPTGNKQKMKVTVSGKAVFCDIAGNSLVGAKTREISCSGMMETTFCVKFKTGESENECVIVRVTYKYMAV